MKARTTSSARLTTLLTLAFTMSLIAAACGGSGSTSSSGDGDQPAGSDAGTESGSGDDGEAGGTPTGHLTLGYVSTVDDLNPFPYGAGSAYFRVALYDPFIRVDDEGELVPMLAESWDFAEDGTSLTLTLREGVTFHDGTPFDSEIAVANIEAFKDPATNVQGANVWASVTPTAVDDLTVELAFDRPLPEIFAVMDTALITKPGELDSGIGTGPFVLDEFNPRQGMTLDANPDYWDDGLPTLASVELREFADPAAAALAAQGGDLDILNAPQPGQVVDLEGAGMTIAEEPSGTSYDILVNAETVPDPLVRQALSLAFDRQRFVDTILQGYGTPLSSIYPPSSPMHLDAPAEVTAFDLDEARSLLDEAGVDTLDLTIMSPTVLPIDQFMPLYQADLATIGINLTIEPADAATWGQAVSQPGAIPDMATHAYGFADLDPALVFSAHPFRVGSNASGFVDDEYAELVAGAAAILDNDERRSAFAEVDEYITAQAFMFPVANPTGLTAIAPGIEGYDGMRTGLNFSAVTVPE